MAVVVVPQVYVERISVGMPDRMSPRDFHGSYLDFYPHYFEGAYPSGNLSWHHLWFLAYLLVFSSPCRSSSTCAASGAGTWRRGWRHGCGRDAASSSWRCRWR